MALVGNGTLVGGVDRSTSKIENQTTLDDAAGCFSSNSSAGNSTKRSRFEEDEDVVEDDLEDRDSRITFHNYPLLIDIYEDSETMAEKAVARLQLQPPSPTRGQNFFTLSMASSLLK
ncbi:hypothetical protein DAPPUDRAFT_239488 [Daphnia pulex]|uniref:Uncharacterized protein n=1 Tax=Daphnia pulex TaxID=6669 RepID=E9G9G9_DAPPU|nr:hypothetical protein DAPPUDRAFT_239488 [Daphnia pulex]|eukprot:EFX83559.1 hypothetical protein DAPPUDRAFT_239488 [Daphnia pulex]